jgi:hypothetical protein
LFGTKKLRTLGSDLGGALKGFRKAMNEPEEAETMNKPSEEGGARVIESGTASCIRPFGLPDNAYDEDDMGKKVLLWESRSPSNDSEEGYDAFLLVGNVASKPGLGYSVYDMLTDTDCANDLVQVGDEIPAKPGNNQLGSVKKALKDLNDEYGELT